MSDYDERPLPPDGHVLFKLGRFLADWLDADYFNNAEPFVLDAWEEIQSLQQQVKETEKFLAVASMDREGNGDYTDLAVWAQKLVDSLNKLRKE